MKSISIKWLLFLIVGSFFSVAHAQLGLALDGTDDYVDCGNNTSVQITGTAITLEAWIYPTAWKTGAFDGNIICKEDNSNNNGYMLRVGAGGKVNFALGYANKSWAEMTSASTVLSLNTWQHVAGTYDGSMMRIYVNGVATDSMAAAISIANASTVNLWLGAHPTYGRQYQGILDEVRIWNTCRSTAQLNASMNSEICAVHPNLKAYYKFNHGKASANNFTYKKLSDISGNGNQGTLGNFSLSGSTSNWVKGKSLSKGVSTSTESVTRCDYFYSPSAKYKWVKTGTYKDTIFNYMECDSVITFNLTIRSSSTSSMKAHACSSYKSPSGVNTWTKSGVYKDYLRNYLGCDSIITITLTIGGSYDTIQASDCKSFTSPSKKYTWTSTGSYNDTLVNYRNCDSVITVDLTILKPTKSNLGVKACGSYTSPSGKYVYSQTGVYADTLKNYRGCDSIITIAFKSLVSYGYIKTTVCRSYVSPSKKYTWVQSGNYADTIKNYAACDSILSINLTVLAPTTATISPSACESYRSPGRKRIFTASGTYMDTLMNYKGCDSILTINLTVTSINNGISLSGQTLTATQSGATYRWLNCTADMTVIPNETGKSFSPKSNGIYAAEIKLNNCMDTTECMTVSGVGVGVATLNTQVDFELFPNPNNGVFHLQIPEELKQGVVSILDQTGKVVYTENLNNSSTAKVSQNLLPGLYLIKIQSVSASASKIVVIHP